MAHDAFYVNDNYPLTVNVYDSDGVTPILPVSATIDIVDQDLNTLVVTNASVSVASGLATYFILSGSDVAQSPGHYIGYMRVTIDANNSKTIAVPFDVLSKSSALGIFRWRAKVEDAAPSEEHTSDGHARNWIDQAVDFLNRRYTTGYTSTLGNISPSPTTNDLELIIQVAALMARTAWWAGKGTYRDSEISFDATPFAAEWAAIEQTLQRVTNDEWFDFPATDSVTMYNRDKVYYDGIKYDSPDYWWRDSGDTDPDTEIPI